MSLFISTEQAFAFIVDWQLQFQPLSNSQTISADASVRILKAYSFEKETTRQSLAPSTLVRSTEAAFSALTSATR